MTYSRSEMHCQNLYNKDHLRENIQIISEQASECLMSRGGVGSDEIIRGQKVDPSQRWIGGWVGGHGRQSVMSRSCWVWTSQFSQTDTPKYSTLMLFSITKVSLLWVHRLHLINVRPPRCLYCSRFSGVRGGFARRRFLLKLYKEWQGRSDTVEQGEGWGCPHPSFASLPTTDSLAPPCPN